MLYQSDKEILADGVSSADNIVAFIVEAQGLDPNNDISDTDLYTSVIATLDTLGEARLVELYREGVVLEISEQCRPVVDSSVAISAFMRRRVPGALKRRRHAATPADNKKRKRLGAWMVIAASSAVLVVGSQLLTAEEFISLVETLAEIYERAQT